MLDKVREELDVFLNKLKDWRADYWSQATGDSSDKFLIEDFQEEISTYMAPVIRRFREMEYITADEEQQFWGKAIIELNEFAEDIMSGKLPEKPVEKEININELISRFKVHRDLIVGGHIGKEIEKEQKIKLSDIAIELIPELIRRLENKND